MVTRSEEGMSLYAKGEDPVHVPAYAVKVRDVSGPGDTVVAILAVMLALGADYESAMRAANAGAAVVVGKPGTATVSVDELRHRLLPAAATALEDKIVFDRCRARCAPRRLAHASACASGSPTAVSICCIAGTSG